MNEDDTTLLTGVPPPPMKPGTYNLSAAQYHAAEGISKSGLDRIARSPAHFRYGKTEETDTLRLGTAVHAAVLEPILFAQTYACAEGRRNKKAEKIELTPMEWDICSGIADAISDHPTCRELLSWGEAEESIFWHDAETLLLCRARPDWTRYGDGIRSSTRLIDLKTTKDASPSGFARAVETYRYHVQAAFYLDGWRAANGGSWCDEFVFIAVEKTAPFAIGLYRLPDWQIEEGRQLYRRDLAVYEDCLNRDEWPGYSEDIITLEMRKNDY